MKKTSLLSQELEIILGGLLGDSHIRKDNYIVCFGQSEKQFEYLKWKHQKLKRISSDIYKTTIKDKYYRYNFETLPKYNKDIKTIFNMTSNVLHKKQVTRRWLNLLTPLSLAVWWMDKGYLSIHKGNRYGKLCTHNFSYKEHLIIKKYFKTVWDINVDIKTEKGKYYFCRLNIENLKKLISIIYPHVIEIPSMIYKIDLNYIDNVQMGEFQHIYNIIKNNVINLND